MRLTATDFSRQHTGNVSMTNGPDTAGAGRPRHPVRKENLMFKTNSLFTVLGAALLLPALALASPDGPGRHRGHDIDAGHGPAMQDDEAGWQDERGGFAPGQRGIDLSDAQRDRLFDIRHQQAPAVHAQKTTLRQARQALRALGDAERFDEAQARTLTRKIADATASLTLLRAQEAHRIRAMLTPEQRTQMDSRRDAKQHCRMRDNAERTRPGRRA